jgi:hypothetical protein
LQGERSARPGFQSGERRSFDRRQDQGGRGRQSNGNSSNGERSSQGRPNQERGERSSRRPFRGGNGGGRSFRPRSIH